MSAAADPETSPTPPPARPPASPDEIRRRITRLSVAAAVLLIAIKAFALGASGSVSILASLTDSVLDLAASLATYFAVRWAAAPPDAEHRFGHGKAEAMAGLVQSGLIFASAVFVGWEAIRRVFDPQPVTGGAWALGAVVLSMAVTGGLVWMQGRALRAAPSLAVSGDRAHYASDLAANAVVLVGVVSGAWLAAPGLDAAAGLIVAVWLGWGAVGLLGQAADQLLDRAAPREIDTAVTAAVLSDPRIGGLHRLRTRTVGDVVQAQMHIDLDAGLSLAAAHDIVEAAEARIRAAVPGADVIIHADPRGPAAAPAPAVPVTPSSPDPGDPTAEKPG
ncbi:cation diffusion facilitator family transporter [Brevundimonas sp. VNH65]|uniref:cation diffusion facilitator family transporter n=1 Tax=Brevundimonas sp. VNH65 TaxID=3400917 RepID=UPI003C0EEBBF